MKRIFIISILGISFLITALPVQAAFFTLTPENNIEVTNIGDVVSFDLTLNIEADPFPFNSWDLNFTFDTAELVFDSTVYGLGMRTLFETDDGAGNLRFVAELPIGQPDIATASTTQYLLATLNFTVSSVETFDTNPDLALLSQIGTFDDGFWDSNWNQTQLLGAEGGDVGAVPVPSSLLLLGGGLCALLGVSRKKK